MKSFLIGIFIVVGAVLFSGCVTKPNVSNSKDITRGYYHGEVLVKENSQRAWDNQDKKFLSLEKFWRTYAERNGGLTWGQSENYPPYNDVKENDLFMVEIGSEICLMEFYHDRWRRANDVRRWDNSFNEFSACSKVFN